MSRMIATLEGPASSRERFVAALERYGLSVLGESRAAGGGCVIATAYDSAGGVDAYSIEKCCALTAWQLVGSQYAPRRPVAA